MFRTDGQKSKKDPERSGVKKLALAVDYVDAKTKLALAQAQAIARGMDLTKELGNLSANVCTPTYLANTAKKLGKDYKFDVEVLDRKQLEALKMYSFLSVTNGSEEPPKFIVMKHMGGKKNDAPVVLVGKGITFDTGGISLKARPRHGRDEIRHGRRRLGAGHLQAPSARWGWSLNVVGVIASCENMPSGRATKPGDIVTSMAGLTIEILNTDAEGRLVLCDALAYAERFNPAAVVDIATLTGACIVALGHHNSGLFARDDDASNHLVAAGTAGRRFASGRHRLAPADRGVVQRSAEIELCRSGQYRFAGRRQLHRRGFPRKLYEELHLGAPGYRRYGMEIGRRQGCHRPSGAAAVDLFDQSFLIE